LQAVAVGYGFGSLEELAGERPAYHVQTLAQLHQAFIG
jgi:phosphoglycolate phosphatase